MPGSSLKQLALILLVMSSGLVACSTQPPRESFTEQFTTQINDDGEKQFQLALQHDEARGRPNKSHKGRGEPGGGPGGGPGGRPPHGGGRGGGPGDFEAEMLQREQALREELQQRLVVVINKTGYCREGYEITDEQIGFRVSPTLRGICSEKATEADRQAFANSEPDERPLVIYEDLRGV